MYAAAPICFLSSSPCIKPTKWVSSEQWLSFIQLKWTKTYIVYRAAFILTKCRKRICLSDKKWVPENMLLCLIPWDPQNKLHCHEDLRHMENQNISIHYCSERADEKRNFSLSTSFKLKLLLTQLCPNKNNGDTRRKSSKLWHPLRNISKT